MRPCLRVCGSPACGPAPVHHHRALEPSRHPFPSRAGQSDVFPWAQLLIAAIAGGLVFSALTDTCGMAAMLAKLPHNRPRGAGLDATLATLAALRG